VLCLILGLVLLLLHGVRRHAANYFFPVQGTYSFTNDYGEHEPEGAHNTPHIGIDILADKMTPLVAVTDGTVVGIEIPEASWGYEVVIRDAAGYSYHYII